MNSSGQSKSRILITGSEGQLGWELQKTAPDSVELHPVDIDKLDICDPDKVNQKVAELKPDYIINAAAYTAVDKAEKESELAYKVNKDGAKFLAQAAKDNQVRMIQISTDFVFDGNKSSPYLPDDKPNPLCVYGASKQAGDDAVISILGEQATVIRTAWVYSSHGNNFVKTMLKLMQEREELGIVADQIGSPTWACGLSKVVWQSINVELTGIHQWTDAGVASWYDFAIAIQEEAQNLGLLKTDNICTIKPIRTKDFPTPAKRPAYSVMDKTNTWQALMSKPSPHWRASLREMLAELGTPSR